jgi:zinc transporter 2
MMNDEQKDMFNDEKALFLIEQNDENYIGYRKQLEEVNNKVIKKLLKVSIFCIVFMTIEFIGGWIARSLAIMTDAAHLLSDLSGFVISMFSLYIALRPANVKLTYGYHRAEVIGALSSILIIWCLTIWLIIEAVHRFYNPEHIDGLVMMCIASCGLLFNLIMSKILISEDLPNAFEHHEENGKNKIDTEEGTELKFSGPPSIDEAENPILRAAFIHILGDIIQSAGVLVASLIIYFYQDDNPEIVIVDPICTFVFAIIVLSTSIPVSRDCINVLMEASPEHIDTYSLMKELSKINGVVNIHDIHIWCISVGKPSISLHMLSDVPQKSLEEATKLCKKYGIYHATIQVEDNTQRRRESFMHCTHTYDNTIH